MIILLIFFVTSAYSMELSSEKYCFGTSQMAERIKSKVSVILVSDDKVSLEENCFVVQMKEHRRELIQRYILLMYPDTKISFSSAEIKRDPCQLKIEKKKVAKTDEASFGINPNALTGAQTNSSKEIRDVFIIQTLKDFELSFDQDSVLGNCRFINADRYEITLRVKKTLKPFIPTMKESSIVLNDPPKDQETFELRTTLQLQRGERIDIGEVIKESTTKDQKINSHPSLESKDETVHVKETIFLSIQ